MLLLAEYWKDYGGISGSVAGESMSMMTNANLLSLILGSLGLSDHWLLSTVSLGFSEMSQVQLLPSGALGESGTDT